MSKNSADHCVIYVGPTWNKQCEYIRRITEVRGPAKRGDITQLIEQRAPGVIAIVDGIFHSYPAVGHAELLKAIRHGWQVWGLSSMGAIRACEMRSFGMLGYGQIFEQFCVDDSYSDDEVTLLHTPDAPYAPLSEPMVHLRNCLRFLATTGAISASTFIAAERSLKERWYGHRTITALREIVETDCNNLEMVHHAIDNFDQFRSKVADFVRFCEEKPWRQK